MVNWKQTCSVRMAWCYIQEMTLILQAWSKLYDVGAAWGRNHKYLGKQFSGAHCNRAMLDLHHRSEIVWAKFNEHTDTLLNRHVSVRLRFVFSISPSFPQIDLISWRIHCFESTSKARNGEKTYATFNCWIGTLVDNDWQALVLKVNREANSPCGNHGLKNC